jgi:hypothetical protein
MKPKSWFFNDKFVYDGEVDLWTHKLLGNKNLSQAIYLSINGCISSLLLIAHIGASSVHKSSWSSSLPQALNFVRKI